MNKLIVKITTLAIAAVALLTSCNDDPTLQTYIVDSQEKSGFYTGTFPKSILGIEEDQLSAESIEAYRSVDKVNILYLPKNDDKAAMIEEETRKLNNILNDDDYKLLMSFNSDNMKIKLLYEGDTENIDELIAFGSMEQGMGVARVLGNDMNVGKLMKMMNELKDGNNLNPAGMKNVLKDLGIDPDEMKKNQKGVEINIEDENI
jgi:hypothetical protein